MVVTDLSMRMSKCDPRSVRVGLVVDELVTEQVSHRVLPAAPCHYHVPNNSPTGYSLSN
jgi:hypothetical protein